MNHQSPSLLAGTCRAFQRLACVLLPIMISGSATAGAHVFPLVLVDRNFEPTPYLIITGPAPLRFQAVAAPASLTLPAPVEVPTPVPAPAIVPAPLAEPASPPPDIASATATPLMTDAPVSVPVPAKVALPILPDDSQPTIHPEDFLPYFQFPGSSQRGGEVNVIVPVPKSPPAPAALPASSATYTLTPK